MGRVFAQTIDAGRPFQPVRLPGSCDRALFLVRYGETPLGSVELPVASRNLSRYLMSDAIANSFAWIVLGKYFEATLYPSIRTVSIKSNTTGASSRYFETQQRSPQRVRFPVLPHCTMQQGGRSCFRRYSAGLHGQTRSSTTPLSRNRRPISLRELRTV